MLTDATDFHYCSKGLNAQQMAFAVKTYQLHRRVGLATEVIQLMGAQKDLKKVLKRLQSPPAGP